MDRYNIFHVAAKCEKRQILEYLLATLESVEFWHRLYPPAECTPSSNPSALSAPPVGNKDSSTTVVSTVSALASPLSALPPHSSQPQPQPASSHPALSPGAASASSVSTSVASVSGASVGAAGSVGSVLRCCEHARDAITGQLLYMVKSAWDSPGQGGGPSASATALTECTLHRRMRYVLDLYLNMPDKLVCFASTLAL